MKQLLMCLAFYLLQLVFYNFSAIFTISGAFKKLSALMSKLIGKNLLSVKMYKRVFLQFKVGIHMTFAKILPLFDLWMG